MKILKYGFMNNSNKMKVHHLQLKNNYNISIEIKPANQIKNKRGFMNKKEVKVKVRKVKLNKKITERMMTMMLAKIPRSIQRIVSQRIKYKLKKRRKVNRSQKLMMTSQTKRITFTWITLLCLHFQRIWSLLRTPIMTLKHSIKNTNLTMNHLMAPVD